MKKENKTIAIFSGYQLPHLGGVENYTDNLSKELVKKGYRVLIISSDYSFAGKIVEEKDNIKKIYFPVRKLFVSRYPIPKKNKNYKLAIKELEKEDITYIIVNTRFYLISLIGAKYGKKHNIPVYLIEHGSQHLTVNNKILDFFGAKYEHILTHNIKKYVDYYYGVSKAACEWQKHFKIESNGVWYNSINDFSKDIKLEKNKNNEINVTYAGRVIKQKGLDRLIESFIKVSNESKNLILNIAGDGDYLNELKSKYNNKNIKFLGKLDFNKLKKLYAITDIFVYAPIWPEGLPTSILEAGLMKCAIIASPQGGIKEVIRNNENGLMINNETELYDAMKKLVHDKNIRNELANKIEKKIKKEFIWEITCKKILKDLKNNGGK